MFTRMANLVAEQGEVVDRIDADMTVASENVNAGYAELNKFYISVQQNRGFILKIFAVLIFVIVLFAWVRR
jgi:syntaxin 5